MVQNMWPKHYRNTPEDTPLKKERVEPGCGIVGCEMHDLFGWGHTYDLPKKKPKGMIRTLLDALFGVSDE